VPTLLRDAPIYDALTRTGVRRGDVARDGNGVNRR
jgi:hypothetical protein